MAQRAAGGDAATHDAAGSDVESNGTTDFNDCGPPWNVTGYTALAAGPQQRSRQHWAASLLAMGLVGTGALAAVFGVFHPHAAGDVGKMAHTVGLAAQSTYGEFVRYADRDAAQPGQVSGYGGPAASTYAPTWSPPADQAAAGAPYAPAGQWLPGTAGPDGSLAYGEPSSAPSMQQAPSPITTPARGPRWSADPPPTAVPHWDPAPAPPSSSLIHVPPVMQPEALPPTMRPQVTTSLDVIAMLPTTTHPAVIVLPPTTTVPALPTQAAPVAIAATAAPATTSTRVTTTTRPPTTATTTTTKAQPSLYCFSILMPKGDELALIRTQLARGLSIFACESWQAFSSTRVELTPGPPARITAEVIGDMHCEYGGKYHLALNSEIFVRAWKRVFRDGEYRKRGWTVKVDPDAVFIPQRLRDSVVRADPDAKVYLNNCDQGLHGPIEVIARGGMKAFEAGVDHCVEVLKHEFNEQGEDVFLRHCLGVLKVARVDDFKLLDETVCFYGDPVTRGCYSGKVSFHPFKKPETYFKCLRQAEGEE